VFGRNPRLDEDLSRVGAVKDRQLAPERVTRI